MTRFFIPLISAFAFGGCLRAASPLPRSAPEAQGVSSAAVREFIEAANKQVDTMNSFMLVRHGRVVAEGWWAPYAAEIPHTLYSLSKSFTSSAVGLAISEGKLSLDDEVLRFFPDDAPANPTNNLKSMRVRDLLCMATGHQTEPRLSMEAEEPWTKIFLGHPVPNKPGTHFLYNTPGTYMQSAIVQKVTGQTVLEYLQPRLFEPLGIENPRWGKSPQGVNLGGYGLDIRTEDIAKFGQLYLQKGRWEGRQLIPTRWVEAATSRQTSNGSNPASDWEQGYGYQFWRCRNGAYRGDGAFGQFCIVMPEQDAVIAITSGTRDMQGVMNIVWDKLLPAFHYAPLPQNAADEAALKSTLARLSVQFPSGTEASSLKGKIAGRTFHFEKNTGKVESMRIETGDGLPGLRWRANGSDYHLAVGYKEWKKGRLAYGSLAEQPVAASGAWAADGTYTVRLCFFETPYYLTVKLSPTEDGLRCEAELNVSLTGQRQLVLAGRAD